MFRTGWRSVVRRSMQQGRPFSFFLIAAVLATGAQAAVPAVTALAATPNISSVTPGTASPGTTVSINGSGFGATQISCSGANKSGCDWVRFSDNGQSWGVPGNASTFVIKSWSDTQITFTLPVPSGSTNQWRITPNTTGSVTVVTGASTDGNGNGAGGTASNTANVAVPNTDNPADYYGNNGSGWGAIGVSPDTDRK